MMWEKIKTVLVHPWTPIGGFAAILAIDGILHRMGADGLSAALCTLVLVAMAISTLVNYAFYGVAMKRVCIALCAVTALILVLDGGGARESDVRSADDVSFTGNYSYGGYNNYSGYNNNDSGRNQNSSWLKDSCGICNDSGKCHVCRGKGNFYCDSIYCTSGKCTSCHGSGLYDHGSYLSDCLTCHGDGRCDICKGTTRRDCTNCRGTGDCKHCS